MKLELIVAECLRLGEVANCAGMTGTSGSQYMCIHCMYMYVMYMYTCMYVEVCTCMSATGLQLKYMS